MRPTTNPTEKLVVWGVTYYAYCVIAHMQTVLSGLVQLLEAKNIPTAFVVGRHVFEWTAHACFISRNSETYFRKRNGAGLGICTRLRWRAIFRSGCTGRSTLRRI